MATGVTQAIIDQQPWIDDLAKKIQPLLRDAFAAGGETGHTIKDLLNGVWLGHALHPALTDVPLGAWTMTAVLDLLSAVGPEEDSLDRAADVTLGFGALAALGAAVTGITDWADTSGPQRRLGMAHGLLNVAGLTLNLTSLAARGAGARGLGRLLSLAGYGFTITAAYVGGELVFSLGQAVNRDAWITGPKKFTDAGPEADLSEGQMVKVDVKGNPVVLLRHDDGIHAFGGICPHAGCYLWEGELNGHTITCPCHGSEFDIRDGRVLHGPATASVPSYEVQTQEGKVQVRMKQG